MGFSEAAKNVFKKWLDFKTRISRSEFWWGFFVLCLTNLWITICTAFASWYFYNINIFDQILMLDDTPWTIFDTLNIIASIYISLAGWSLAARRLHDVNRSGWWQLLNLTIIGIPVLIFWYLERGHKGSNQWGLNPIGKMTSIDQNDQF